jgi:hypothetical protein
MVVVNSMIRRGEKRAFHLRVIRSISPLLNISTANIFDTVSLTLKLNRYLKTAASLLHVSTPF